MYHAQQIMSEPVKKSHFVHGSVKSTDNAVDDNTVNRVVKRLQCITCIKVLSMVVNIYQKGDENPLTKCFLNLYLLSSQFSL